MQTRLTRVEQVERNRELLLAAALRVFAKQGYVGATLEAIAEEAGFSKGVVYSQFASKADLFLTLLERRIAERADHNDRITKDLAGAEGVKALLQQADRDSRAEPGWARLLVEFRAHAGRDPAVNRRYAQAHAGTLQRLAKVLDRLHERAGLAPAFSTYAMAEFILAMGSGTTLERLANPDALGAERLDMVVLALGLRPPTTRAAPRPRRGKEHR